MPRKPYTDRTMWRPEQIAVMERLIELARGIRGGIRWAEHLAEIGHPLSSVKSMANYLRNRQVRVRYQAERKLLRAAAAATARPKPDLQPDYSGHLALTPKSRLMFDQELRDRIRERGLTAGFFGDPMPGRSALDRKLAAVTP